MAEQVKPATYDDVLRAPEHMVAELVDGVLLMSPRPAPPHAACASALGGELNFRLDGPRRGGDGDRPGGWWILYEPELHLGRVLGRAAATEVVLVPDFAGWPRERMPALPDAAAFELPPSWVCEVLSPATARTDRIRKLPLYAEAGVEHVWLVDPVHRLIEVYRPLEGLPARIFAWAPELGESPPRPPPFEALPLEVDRWWSGT